MKNHRRRVLKSAAIALSALLAAPAGLWAQTPAPVKIALIESLSGAFANTGEAVYRNLLWAVERVNARGGVRTAAGPRPLALERYDSKGQNEEALSALRSAIDDGAQFVMQGNSSSTAAALIDAINKHNERAPGQRVLFLNYSAVDPVLTNDKCSFWHFRFDAHADMRMAALMQVIRDDRAVKSVHLIGQDYSFGQAVLREARRQLAAQRPDMQLMVEALAQAIDQAGVTEPVAVAKQLAQARVSLFGQSGSMRASDHQFQQPLVVGVMDRQGAPGVKFDVEGSGYGFRVIRRISPAQAEQPTSCRMLRPA